MQNGWAHNRGADEYVDIAIVGAGPAGLAAAVALSATEFTTAVFESGAKITGRRRNSPESIIRGVGGAGLYSDGKFSFYPSATALWDLDDVESLKIAYDWLAELLGAHGLESPEMNFQSERPRADVDSNFKIYPSFYLPFEAREALITQLAAQAGSAVRTASRVLAIEEVGNEFILVAETPKGRRSVSCKVILFAGGRFGSTALTQMMPDLPTVFRRYEIGIRVEQPAEEFVFRDHRSLDVKEIMNGESNVEEWRTFCTCRNGEVVETDWQGLKTFSGRADEPATLSSNIGVNLRFKTHPDDDGLLGELHDALSGNTTPFHVGAEQFCDATQTFFGPILDTKFRKRLEQLIDASSLRRTHVYGPCVEGVGFYPDINGNLKVNSHDVWVAGDATGLFRGLTAALISGYFAGRQVVKNLTANRVPTLLIKESPVDPMPVIFTAQSKAHFYCRDAVCEFVLRQGCLPLNPFRVFEYFLGDRVERDMVRKGNNQLVAVADEIWVFGPIADGVLFEIVRARRLHKPVRFYSIATRSDEIKPIDVCDVTFEPEVHARQIKRGDLLALVADTLAFDERNGMRQLNLPL